MTETALDRPSQAISAPTARDDFIDLCRAFSLIVVVIWHIVFTILVWTPSGPIASNPIGYTDGMWVLTWLLQVMPVFFFVGGYAHKMVLGKVAARGGGYWAFVGGRAKRLAIPSAALIATWSILAVVGMALGVDRELAINSAILVVSPLWFMAVYLLMVFIAPPMLALHNRLGPLVIVVLAGAAGLIDVLRFTHHVDWVSLLNLVFVWGLCHQLGFFYGQLITISRQWLWTMTLGGLFSLYLFVFADFYPGSMVGVPGDRVSNMAPPTLCIISLVFFQSGLVLLIRPWLVARLERPRWAATNDIVNRFSLPLFLFHTTGYALALVLLIAIGKYETPTEPTAQWWLQRPLFLVLPLVCTMPVIYLFGRRWARSSPNTN